MKNILFIILTLLLFVSCDKNKGTETITNDENQVTDGIELGEEKEVNPFTKNDVKGKTPDELFIPKDYDKDIYPIAGVWVPANEQDGTIVFQADGTFQYYGPDNKKYVKEPEKKGTYTMIGDSDVQLTIGDKKEVYKIKKLGNYVTMGDLGTFWPAAGVELKKEKPAYADPVNSMKICLDIQDSTLAKLYPYLTKKSILQLASIGIRNKTQFEQFRNNTNNLEKLFKSYDEIKSVEQKSEDDTTINFDVTLVIKGVETKKAMFLKKENGLYKCPAFDNYSLDYSRIQPKGIEFKFYRALRKYLTPPKDNKEAPPPKYMFMIVYDYDVQEDIEMEIDKDFKRTFMKIDEKSISLRIARDEKSYELVMDGVYKWKYNTPNEAYIEFFGKVNGKSLSNEIIKLSMRDERIEFYYNLWSFEFAASDEGKDDVEKD